MRARQSGPAATLAAMLAAAATLALAAGCARPPATRAWQVDGARAWAETSAFLAPGPRPAGTPAAAAAAARLQRRLGELGLKATLDEWPADTPNGALTCRNVQAVIPGRGRDFIVIGSHYDSKRLDGCPGFVGANDSGSSSGLLLELARILHQVRPAWCGPELRLVWFDGEESIGPMSATNGLHGSRRLVSQLARAGELGHCRAMFLLDMVGDRELTLTIPPDCDPKLTASLFAVAERQGVRHQVGTYSGGSLWDDHTPFAERGVPTLNLIDFSYGPNNSYWHSDQDTLDKLSGASLATAGNLLLGVLATLE